MSGYQGVERRVRDRADPHYIAVTQAIYDGWVKRQAPLSPTQRRVAAGMRRRFGFDGGPTAADYELAGQLATDRERLIAAMATLRTADDAAADLRLAALARQAIEAEVTAEQEVKAR